MDRKSANDAYIAADRACDADPTPANLAAVTAAAAALADIERAAGANPWEGEADRAKAERLDRDADKATRDAASYRRTMDGSARRNELAYDAAKAIIDNAMDTEPSDL